MYCVSQTHFAEAPCISNTIYMEYVHPVPLPDRLLPGSKTSNLNVYASNISNFAYMHTWDVNIIFHDYQRYHSLTTHGPNFTIHQEFQTHYRFLKLFLDVFSRDLKLTPYTAEISNSLICAHQGSQTDPHGCVMHYCRYLILITHCTGANYIKPTC